jgi:DNA helicase-2/ATP-dependent DNA helicase PcrA
VGSAPKKAGGGNFSPGDSVAHKVFGEGEVISAKTMGSDTLLEIRFGEGVKKVMANYANLSKA